MNAEFSERPFAAGTLTGLRAFRATNDGTLTGVVYPYDFNNGVNEGICATTFGDKPNHEIGMLDCTCGYYAFFDGSNTYYDKPQYRADTVAAIVEGFGVCTVGGKGFRSSKARLVALVAPTPLRVGGLPNTEAVALLSGVLGITSLAVRILTALPRTRWVVGAAVTAATRFPTRRPQCGPRHHNQHRLPHRPHPLPRCARVPVCCRRHRSTPTHSPGSIMSGLPVGGFGIVGLGVAGDPSPTRKRPDLCADQGHPGVTYNTNLDITFCLCGASMEFGNSATHGIDCCGGPLEEVVAK